MSQKLVTIATFDKPPQAQLTRNAIQEAGFRSVVTDEAVVAMDWLLSNAVGGIKVQVWEHDAHRAVAVLEKTFGERGEMLGAIDPSELAAQAEAAEREDSSEEEFSRPVAPVATLPGPHDETPLDVPSERDQYARRAFYAGIAGFWFHFCRSILFT